MGNFLFTFTSKSASFIVKRLHTFILKSYIGPFVLTFFIALFLLLMQFLWKYIDDLIGKGLDIGVIVELLFYATVTLVPMALPLAILLSSIMTFGNLGENNELMALKSSGISLVRIMFPLIIFIIMVCVGAFYFSNNVLPFTNLKMGSLLYDVRHQRPEVSIKEGMFTDAIEGYSIKISKKNKNTSMLYGLMIYDHSENKGNRKVTVADSATLKITSDNRYMVLTMYSGIGYTEVVEKRKRKDQKKFPHRQEKFSEQRVLIDMSGLGFERTDESLFKNHYQMLNLDQLQYAVDSLEVTLDKRGKVFKKQLINSNYIKRVDVKEKDSLWFLSDNIPLESLPIDSLFNSFVDNAKQRVYDQAMNNARSTKSFVASSSTEFVSKSKWIKRHEIEWHRKFTLSFACLILFFIGAPLGAIIRKGGLGMPVVISVVFFIIYYVISISGEKSAKIGAWPSWLGMWLSSITLFPLGLFLTYKAANDSVILNIDTYLKSFKKLFLLGKSFKAFIGKVLKKESK